MSRYNLITNMLALRRKILGTAVQIGIRNISISRAVRKTFYEVLGVSKDASQAEIKNAYFELTKKYHPDRIAATDENLTKFREISDAYEVLGNENSRRLYDSGIVSDQGTPPTDDISDPVINFYQKRQDFMKSGGVDTWAKIYYESPMYRKHMVYRLEKVEKNLEDPLRLKFTYIVFFLLFLIINPSYKNSFMDKLLNNREDY